MCKTAKEWIEEAFNQASSSNSSENIETKMINILSEGLSLHEGAWEDVKRSLSKTLDMCDILLTCKPNKPIYKEAEKVIRGIQAMWEEHIVEED